MLVPAIPKKVWCVNCDESFEGALQEEVACPSCESTGRDLATIDAEYDVTLSEIISEDEFGEGD